MFVGKQDPLADPMDTEWVRDTIGKMVVHYEEINDFDHSSFTMANDMSYMGTVVSLI